MLFISDMIKVFRLWAQLNEEGDWLDSSDAWFSIIFDTSEITRRKNNNWVGKKKQKLKHLGKYISDSTKPRALRGGKFVQAYCLVSVPVVL